MTSTKVDQNSKLQKKFIPAQVGNHNKAVDVLIMLRKCEMRIIHFKKQIDGVDADMQIMGVLSIQEASGIRQDLITLHDWQVTVYRRILAYYLKLVCSLYKPALYQHMYFHSQTQPAALKNGKAA